MRKTAKAFHIVVYLMSMVSHKPCIIAGHQVSEDKSANRIQDIVDSAPYADYYCTDGYFGYLSVIYPGKHIYNCHDKSDTFTVESVNADFRDYIPLLRRRSRCFARSIETLSVSLSMILYIERKEFSRREKAQRPHRTIIRSSLVRSELRAKIGERIKAV